MFRAVIAIIVAASSVAAASDRGVAEWVLRAGGTVVTEGGRAEIRDITQLPVGEFRVRAVNLVATTLKPKDFQRLAALDHLKQLYISGRTWHSLPASTAVDSLTALRSLTTLETFALSLPVQTEIPMEDDAIAKLAGLVHLRELRLAQTKVKGRTLAPFTEVRLLELDHTHLDDTGMAALAHMTHLAKLYARDTLITDDGLKYLQDLHELTELDLYGTKIGDTGIGYLKGLTGLTKLNLLGAAVTDAGLEQLAGLERLEELNLYRAKITNASIDILKRFPNLRDVDLRYTRVTPAGACGAACLAAALPRRYSGYRIHRASQPLEIPPRQFCRGDRCLGTAARRASQGGVRPGHRNRPGVDAALRRANACHRRRARTGKAGPLGHRGRGRRPRQSARFLRPARAEIG